VRIKDNFEGQMPKWNLANVQKNGDVYEVKLAKGQKLEAAL